MTEDRGPCLPPDDPDPDPADPDFRMFYRAQHQQVFRALRYFGVPEHSLDDALQDVFVIVHRHWARREVDRDPRGWLWEIARRTASTHRRSSFRAGRKRDVARPPSGPPAPDDALGWQEQIEAIDGFLGTLSRRYRDVFYLSEVEGCTAPEVAQMLGLRLNTVYTRLRRARERFAKAMAEHIDEAPS